MKIPFKNIPAVNIVFVGSKLAANESQISRKVLDNEKGGVIQSFVPHSARWQSPGHDG